MSSLPRRLPARGPVADRWRRHQEDSRYAVVLRSKGRCEVAECFEEYRDWHHLFPRRGTNISEPWVSSPALTLAMCRPHHNAVHRLGHSDWRDQLRWQGLVKLCQKEAIPITLLNDYDPEGAAGACEDWLRSRE